MKAFDLRSDTVTQPTMAMRHCMMNAALGDDVYREDPTVLKLERRAAQLMGKEAALFMPTGSMGNQVALATWSDRGGGVVCERHAHILLFEQAAMSALSGLHPLILDGDEQGCLDPDQVEQHLRPAPYYRVPAHVLTVEVTHNMSGGTLPELEKLAAIYMHAQHAHVPVHMDGARLFNAAVAYQVAPKEIAAYADSVMFCLSKGLGAPIGSMLCGPAHFMERALPVRKRFGGGMRQVGMLAAAGLYALEHHVDRLIDDHICARKLAFGLAQLEGLKLNPSRFPTNIVYARTGPEMAAHWVRESAKRGVLINALGSDIIRLCTHLDVDESSIVKVLELMQEVNDALDSKCLESAP